MEINQLRVFASVYRKKSFTKASDELGLSQPTVSEHIKNLEAELGQRLFDRLPRTVIPTQAAEVLFSKALRIIGEVDELKEVVSSAAGRIKGKLLIGASTIPGTYMLPVLAAGFSRKHEGISFEITIDDSRKTAAKVMSDEVMLGAVGAVMEQGRLEYKPFVEDDLVLASRPGLLPKTSLSPGDLTQLPFIMREEGSGTLKTMTSYLNREGIRSEDLNVVAVLGSTASVTQALKAGLGVSVLSRVAIQEDIDNGTLVKLNVKGPSMRRSFHLVTRKHRTLPSHYAAFYDYVLKHAKRG